MNIYAEVGKTLQQVGGDCPEGWIAMTEQRPEVGMVALEDGTWGTAMPSISDLIKANNSTYEAATTALTADYPQLEKDTWPTQDEETKSWISDPDNASTPWINKAASERGIEREEYLRRTLVKSRQFKLLSSFLTGRRQKYEDSIKSGQSPVLDYTLTVEILLELQQIAQNGMQLPTDQLKGVLL